MALAALLVFAVSVFGITAVLAAGFGVTLSVVLMPGNSNGHVAVIKISYHR